MTTKITPTVGRKVWFYWSVDQKEPIDATIIKVWGNTPEAVVNLDIAHPLTGKHEVITSVGVGDEKSPRMHYRWMPYQQGQAAKQAGLTVDAPRLSIDAIARVAHEVNRAYCQALGDHSQKPWAEAPEWQRVSARMGVDLHLSGNFGPEASHHAWSVNKRQDGWVYGPIKDETAKTHPCLVPFADLPPEQQAKDYLFRGVVHALKSI